MNKHIEIALPKLIAVNTELNKDNPLASAMMTCMFTIIKVLAQENQVLSDKLDELVSGGEDE